MSDTSIIQSGSSKDDYVYDMEDNYYYRKDNCWTRIGANVCVGILTLITIFLLIALIYTLSRQHEIEKLRRLKAEKNGEPYDLTDPEGVFSVFGGIFGGSSDNNEAYPDGNDYTDS